MSFLQNDADATAYKRKPIMTEGERYAAVASCKYVHAVIEGSPIFHTVSNESKGEEKTVSERMVEDHKIHYFAGE
jgi:glycerol-3-phosphate cytidylyltransferase-like family protein